jgi:hypothetical protein
MARFNVDVYVDDLYLKTVQIVADDEYEAQDIAVDQLEINTDVEPID